MPLACGLVIFGPCNSMLELDVWAQFIFVDCALQIGPDLRARGEECRPVALGELG
jgi:hypothetical protein